MWTLKEEAQKKFEKQSKNSKAFIITIIIVNKKISFKEENCQKSS